LELRLVRAAAIAGGRAGASRSELSSLACPMLAQVPLLASLLPCFLACLPACFLASLLACTCPTLAQVPLLARCLCLKMTVSFFFPS